MKKNILLSVLVALLFCGCKKDKEASPLLFITPDDIVLNYSMGQVVTFTIKASTPVGFSNLTISYKEQGTFSQTIIDSTLSGVANFNWNYEYKIPSQATAYVMDIYFNFTDKNGTVLSGARRINVSVNNSTLSEYSGNVFYSKKSGHEDSYNLINRVALYSNVAATSVRDIQNDGTYDSVDSLARSWVSPSGSKFVRFNGYDYDNATYASVVNTYDSGVKVDTIKNLQQGDILFTKVTRNNVDSYMVLKLTSIFDLTGASNDTYIFSIKK
jgi:hypothetical protein